MVTPSYLLAIPDEFEPQGLDTSAGSIKIGICGAVILADPRLAPHYLLEVRRTRRLDEAKSAAADTDARAAAGEELARHIKSRIGISAANRRRRTRPGRALARQGQTDHRPPTEELLAVDQDFPIDQSQI